MNLEKLKDTARKHEQKEDWRKAIDAYQKIIQQFDAGRDADADLTIYNRVGDLQLKLNDPGAAVQSYERAAELYAEQGFLNNAIALCGKVLRVNPGRVQVYLQLAHLHARKNVVSEAKRNLIEYMERMNSLGKLDEAFAQLKAFADQHSANQDIRMMLVELLRAASRAEEAQEQLEKIATELEARGDRAGARLTRERLQPAGREESPEPAAKNDLVFLETGFEPPRAPTREPAAAAAAPEPVPVPAPAPVEGLEVVAGGAVPGVEDAAAVPIAGLDVFEPASLDAGTAEAGPLQDLQAGSFEPEVAPEIAPVEGLDRVSADDAMAVGGELDIIHAPDLADSLLGDALPAEPESGDAAVELTDTGFTDRYLDDFDIGDPLSLESRRSESEDLLEEEEPLLPSPELASDILSLPDEAVPPAPADSTALSELQIPELEDRIIDDPESGELHRALADRLVREADLGRAVEEYLLAIGAFEHHDAWMPALDAVDALLEVEPDAIRHQQKRVELAYRSGDRDRLLAAYLSLAEALVRAEALDKAIAVYHRVLEHNPDNASARDALTWLASVQQQKAPAAEEKPVAAPAVLPVPPASSVSSAGFVDLGSMVIEPGDPMDTRMRVDGERPTGDEQKDFQETLAQFKKGIEANLGTEDYEAHYDLGVAFKEMGLLDEAIAEFQKALRSPDGRLRTSEALGVTFYEKQQYAISETILRRAVESLPGGDEEKIGLLYWLGRSSEALGKPADARQAYERALAVDIRFMDLGERVKSLGAGQRA